MKALSRSSLLSKFIASIPAVKKELRQWATLAHQVPEPLRSQALLSIKHKSFHCIGGSVYAHYPGVNPRTMLPLVVAFQTISDYLDNLCDRMSISDPSSFRLLHKSIIHALSPGASLIDHYELYPYSEDVYLPRLVSTCQKFLSDIPHYGQSQPFALRLAELYCELQVLKHVSPGGEKLLRNWVESNSNRDDVGWNEWAAACGSTLGIFLLMALGFHSSTSYHSEILDAYFPWIQGLHILLDYFIDLDEDDRAGDLNFITFYPSTDERNTSLLKFSQRSKRLSQQLPAPQFHTTVVAGLIALYGSDPKVHLQKQELVIEQMVEVAGMPILLNLCRLLRRIGMI